MDNFEYFNPTRLVLGKDMEQKTGAYVKQYGGTKVLLHYGGGSLKKNGIYDKIAASLKDAGIPFVELGGVQPNPRLSLVREGIALGLREGVDFVLAAGGGSSIDSSKAIAAGIANDGTDIWDFFYGPAGTVKKALPVGVILTIPAAGSESSNDMVITNEDGWYKRNSSSEAIIPKFALINPETNFTLPPYQTACGCSDILAHLMERYFTNVKDVDFTDRMLEGAMRSILYNAPQAMARPDDYNVRAEINFCGAIAHNGLLNSGRIGEWSSHLIEHELSAIYDVAHGAGLAVVFPAWMKYCYKYNMDIFTQFAVRVMDVDLAYNKRDEIILEGIRRLEAFFQSIGMPIRLSELEVDDSRLREMADKTATYGDHIGNLHPLKPDDVCEILKLAL